METQAESCDLVPLPIKRRKRQSKWTEERTERILALLRIGLSRRGSAHGAGFTDSEFWGRLRSNSAFRAAVEAAEAEAEKALFELALKGAVNEPAIALRLLERRFADWRKREEVAGKVQHEHLHAQIPAEFLGEFVNQRKVRDLEIAAVHKGIPAKLEIATIPAISVDSPQAVRKTDSTPDAVKAERTPAPDPHAPGPPPMPPGPSPNPPSQTGQGGESIATPSPENAPGVDLPS